ncbi:MAG: hypothetical protein CSA36_02255 [Draconibacterium sp.]|nr:MAG: hypothetical protein CSA36_02255 [Draconibacterium sp.]
MNRRFPRYLSKQAGKLLPAPLLFRMNHPVFLPFYHVVSNRNLPHVMNYAYRNISQFEAELDFFLKYFTPVSLEDLITGNFNENNAFHLTFDDGLKECAEVIAPILLKKGIPATFFVNPAFIDNKALFHKYKASLILRTLLKPENEKQLDELKDSGLTADNMLFANYLQNDKLNKIAEKLNIDFQAFLHTEKPYLTLNQLLHLKDNGFTIGAHSNTHPEFWLIPPAQQLDEIINSIDWVRQNTGSKVRAFAFPFSDHGVDPEVITTMHEKNICDISLGTAGIKYDELPFHYQRYPIEKSVDFLPDLKSEMVYLQLRKLIGKATVKH